ncbi:AAA family ATPase [Arthrobacter zhaoguopingii]|uniref:AAA family ATPase n=1 Tax=Arthrobacter zhaoguopingii TaxID=2681491 RepID=UPI001359CF58|nr:SMC family ATPase [Arthrobacter zhaoguopingii]
MRISRLEIQAFGPFSGRQVVDFDALSAQGLFLLNGPTGAGKSSVLDAICYALYGSVPGVRQGAKRLRSDHAPIGLAPEVELEFTVGARRFSVTRSPQWERPSKRGGGTTTEQARTLLSEFVDGAWVQKSARNDEAGLELLNVLGMDKEQFTRVVMLPQGEFAAFLRADAGSRRELLQRLFSTDRFENIEKLLSEQAGQAASRLATAEDGQRQTIQRALDEAARHGIEADVPAEGQPAPGGQAVVHTLLEAVAARSAEAAAAADRTGRQLEQDKARYSGLAAARARAVALERHRTAQAEHEAGAAEAAALAAAVERHQDARLLAGVLDAAEDAGLEHKDCRTRCDRALDTLRADGTAATYLAGAGDGTDALFDLAPTAARLEAAARAAASDLGVLQAALPDEDRLQGLNERIRDISAKRASLAERTIGLEQRLAELRADKALLEQEAVGLRETAGEETRCAEALEAARALEATIAEHAQADQRRSVAEKNYAAAHEEHLRRKEMWLTRLQLRLEQAAVELAAQLEDGKECAVCGSLEHPDPARAGDDERVTHADEQAAREAHAAAEARLNEARALRDAAALEAARLAALGGGRDAAVAREATQQAQARLTEARRAQQELEDAAARIDALVAREQQILAQLEDAGRAASEAAAQLRSLEDQAAELAARLEHHRRGFGTLHERAEAVDSARAVLVAAREALEALDRAAGRRDKAVSALADALAGSHFDGAAAVREALLEAEALEETLRRIRAHEAAGHRLEAEGESPDITAALQDEAEGRSVPSEDEVQAAGRDYAALGERAADEAVALRLLDQSLSQLQAYNALLVEQEAAVAPLRERHALLRSVADSARGGGDNRYKMPLSTYVLASRLEQVAEAATERLLAMTDGRFALVHSDALTGNKKAGLGLSVIDGWTGNRRDTSTLSGGESFMASLAMALGLADVVQQEAGGIDIETLFVDEGFGSLDDQALEQVMDALDGLRSGGRVVGLVSHVAELKLRIPAQLQVHKDREGSRLEFVDQLQMV